MAVCAVSDVPWRKFAGLNSLGVVRIITLIIFYNPLNLPHVDLVHYAYTVIIQSVKYSVTVGNYFWLRLLRKYEVD